MSSHKVSFQEHVVEVEPVEDEPSPAAEVEPIQEVPQDEPQLEAVEVVQEVPPSAEETTSGTEAETTVLEDGVPPQEEAPPVGPEGDAPEGDVSESVAVEDEAEASEVQAPSGEAPSATAVPSRDDKAKPKKAKEGKGKEVDGKKGGAKAGGKAKRKRVTIFAPEPTHKEEEGDTETEATPTSQTLLFSDEESEPPGEGEGEVEDEGEGEESGREKHVRRKSRKSLRASAVRASKVEKVEKDEKAEKAEEGTKKGKRAKKGKKGKGKEEKEPAKEPEETAKDEKRKSEVRDEVEAYGRSRTSRLSMARSSVISRSRRSSYRASTMSTRSSVSFIGRGDDSSSSSSSDEGRLRRRSKLRPAASKIKRKSRADRGESESDAMGEEEIVQKIIDPSVSVVMPEEEKTGKEVEEKKEKKGEAKAKSKAAKGKGKKQKKKEKKGKKGKKGGKEVKTEAQLEEEAKARAEEERQKALEEKRDAIAKEKKELLEATQRGEQLDMIVDAQRECFAALWEITQAEQAAEEWRQYLVCDGLPAPWDVPGMNTYIHLWEKEVYTVSAERCKERTNEAIDLLEKLEDILDDPFDLAERRVGDWAWVATRFREFQALNLEYCTYRLLRDIKSKMNRIDIPTADFRMQEALFALCLWVSVTLPTPMPNPRMLAKPRISLRWPEMSVEVIFPASLKRDMVAIRGMYTKYDHLTDTSLTYRLDELPPYCFKTLKDACFQEIYCKMRYKYDNRVIVPKEPVEVVQEDGTVVLVEPEPDPELPLDEIPPRVPYQKLEVSASDHCLNTISNELGDTLINFSQYDYMAVINLRKYTIIGGVYYLDLFYQPPQPQGMVSYEVFISTLTEPYTLQTAPFVVKYEPPPPVEPGTRRTPEEIEEELLQQEKELDELIFVLINLPKHVYWLEAPMAVIWDDAARGWTTRDVFDFKNIEEKGYVTFRTGVFRPMAIATLRWPNLPFQAWEIRPEKDGTVTFQLSCAILTLEFHVQRNTICVRDVQSAPNDAFEPHLNVYYRFSKLRKIMRAIGIDLFPFFDTFLYVEGTCEKYWPMENHLYFCMAYLSVVYNMTWSRWNATLDYRAIVYQMRVYRFDRPKQANFDTVLARAQYTTLIDCTEVSPAFSDAPVEGMRFFADLWHLVRSTAAKALRQQITQADKATVTTLYRLYKNVRFLSFS